MLVGVGWGQVLAENARHVAPTYSSVRHVAPTYSPARHVTPTYSSGSGRTFCRCGQYCRDV